MLLVLAAIPASPCHQDISGPRDVAHQPPKQCSISGRLCYGVMGVHLPPPSTSARVTSDSLWDSGEVFFVLHLILWAHMS